MKSFSPAGVAVKGFFGRGARTLGNPGGALFGNGSFNGGGGGSVPVWAPTVVTGPVAAIAQMNATDYVTLLQSGDAIRSTNGGTTWSAPIATPLSGGTGSQIATNGVSVIAQGQTAGAVNTLIRSNDSGLTWTDVTPAGQTPTSVQYLPMSGVYVAFGNVVFLTSTDILTSLDGLAWATTTVAADLTALGNPFVEANGLVICAVDDNNTAPHNASILRSADATGSWTIEGTATFNAQSPGNVGFDGTVWNICGSGVDPTGNQFNASSLDGITWTVENDTAVSPPWVFQIVFNSQFLTYNTATSPAPFAISSNHGGTGGWMGHTVPIVGLQITELADVGAGRLVIGSASGFGFAGVVSTLDFVTYTPELTLLTGSVDLFSQHGSVLLAAGIDDGAQSVIWKRSP